VNLSLALPNPALLIVGHRQTALSQNPVARLLRHERAADVRKKKNLKLLCTLHETAVKRMILTPVQTTLHVGLGITEIAQLAVPGTLHWGRAALPQRVRAFDGRYGLISTTAATNQTGGKSGDAVLCEPVCHTCSKFDEAAIMKPRKRSHLRPKSDDAS
jgi:hypothetical protein